MRLGFYAACAVTIGIVLLLNGCAAFAPQGMSAEQLRAYAQDKNSSAVCWTVLGPGWTSKVMAINLDETKYTGGTVSVTPDCAASITSDVVPKAPVPPKTSTVPTPMPSTPAPAVTAPLSPAAPSAVSVSRAVNSEGNCIQTERDASGRVVASSTIDRANCK